MRKQNNPPLPLSFPKTSPSNKRSLFRRFLSLLWPRDSLFPGVGSFAQNPTVYAAFCVLLCDNTTAFRKYSLYFPC